MAKVAQDTSVDALLAKYDTNGDGKFGKAEVKVIISEMQGAKKRNAFLRMLVAGVLLVLGVSIVMNFVTSLSAMGIARASPSSGVTGEASTGGVTHLATSRRRLYVRRGLSQVSVATFPGKNARALKNIFTTTGNVDGVARTKESSSATEESILSGRIMTINTNSDGTVDYTLKDPTAMSCSAAVAANYGGCIVTVVEPTNSASAESFTVYATPTRRLRELVLSTDDAAHLRKHRKLAIANGTRADLGVDEYRNTDVHGDSTAADCLAYHCFAGDEECDDPSSPDFCLAWDHADKSRCIEPVCRWMFSHEVHDPHAKGARRLAASAGLAEAQHLHFNHPKLRTR
jgi:hypothetical protein